MDFDIEWIVKSLSERRKIFVSEADFQLEMAWEIKEKYPEAKVRLEYCPVFDPSIHIDILVIMNGRWIPIELKYKTRKCEKRIDDEIFNLKNHSAKDENCYLYLKDIQRIENLKENVAEFKAGYTVMLTNDLAYTRKARKEDCAYLAFEIAEGVTKTGKLSWRPGSRTGEIGQVKKPIVLKGSYPIHWQTYSEIDDTTSGLFKYVINKIS
ncbi:hypothetical protein IK112_02760 [Candidatus Saccharibacteria bacterium]|nr:hypothetical protein [Candidatus Saccharibacteria bacterium]